MSRTVIVILLAAWPAWAGQVFEIQTTSDLTLRLAVPGPTPRVLFWSKEGQWAAANARAEAGRVQLTLEVSQLQNGKTTLLVGVPDDVDINDRAAPTISVALDGQPTKPSEKLTTLTRTPKTLTCTIADAANRVAPESVRLLIDGRAVAAKLARTEAGGKRLVFEATLPALDFGAHALAATARDESPFRNAAEWAATLRLVNADDLAQASLGAKVKVDSCYPNYRADPLIDGDSQSCATAGGPEVTWASAETETDHWVEVQLPKAQRVGSVTAYWVRGAPSQRIEVRVPAGGRWETVGSAEPREKCAATTVRFKPRTVSAIRLFQPKGKGLPNRPNLIWLGEIAVNRP